MSKQAKASHPIGRAALAITALGVIAVSANLLVSSLRIGYKNIDFTENKVHTLSEGTRGILKELGAPVTIRYYATRTSDYMPEDLKLHMRRVDDLLAEYQNLSNGKLRVEQLDPQPDTDAEDAANLDGIRGQRLDDQNLYFGMAVSCIDSTATIPFIDPSQETMLEYEISKAIAEVSRKEKPVIGLMSGLPIAGNQNPMMMMQGQQGSPPWVFYSQLAQSYEVKDLTMTPEAIDPSLSMLLVFHPAEITPEAEFAIDQYLLQGGTVVACVDPYSVAAQMTGGGNPMMGGGGNPTASTLPTLLPAWGVTMSTQVVGDLNYQTVMNGNRPAVAVLTIPKEGMPQVDNVLTRDLNSLTFFLPGALTKTGGSGVSMNSLVKSSDKAGLVDAMKASQLDPALSRTIKDMKSYDLVMHLKGNFKSAFPKGKPGAEEPKPETPEGEEKKEEKPAHLTEATKEGNVFLISDIDVFFDQFAYRVQRLGGMQMAQPINGNSSLLFNIVDQAASSGHLIGARSRAAIARPFTKIKDIESEFDRDYGQKVEEKQAELTKLEEELMQIAQQRQQNGVVYMTGEVETKYKELTAKKVEAQKELRELEKNLKREKDRISGNATLYNVAFMPLFVILAGFGLFIKRRAATRAR
ncbi:Gldg family protein [Luteolibacter flavescens]|uniref:Gldg family protein n=1 Tax=Luteolibacter flavescens TaxID=1859460 RepID=A0ABT3FMR5_9BACT|nr:Gldg family protein [Luteolibacter flavescens]MCW1884494.1 Gldg family protein [Luteolibacter flavescens]